MKHETTKGSEGECEEAAAQHHAIRDTDKATAQYERTHPAPQTSADTRPLPGAQSGPGTGLEIRRSGTASG